MSDYKLDNPVWHSLCDTHRHLAVDFGTTKFYQPDYCPFGGFEHLDDIDKHISSYGEMIDKFFIVGDEPILPDTHDIKLNLVCVQMIIHQKIDIEIRDEIVALDPSYSQAIFDLVTSVLPGYFRIKTPEMGNYYGIFRDGKLVAVTGERMQMDEYIEVSAVATHPDYTGQGLAMQLVAHTGNQIIDQGKIPYLHTAENNYKAIPLYEKLGYVTRRKISFWLIGKKE